MSELDKTPAGTVKTRIRAALTRLRSQLGYAMNDDVGCEQVRALAADLAIGTADGQERDAALPRPWPLGAGAVYQGTSGDRRLADSFRAVLAQGTGHSSPPRRSGARPEPSAACSDTRASPPGCSPP